MRPEFSHSPRQDLQEQSPGATPEDAGITPGARRGTDTNEQPQRNSDSGLDAIFSQVVAGEPLGLAHALTLLRHPNITESGLIAHRVRMRLHQDLRVNYHRSWRVIPPVSGTDALHAGEDESLFFGALARFVRAGGDAIVLLSDPRDDGSPEELLHWRRFLQQIRNDRSGKRLSLWLDAGAILSIASSEATPLPTALGSLCEAGVTGILVSAGSARGLNQLSSLAATSPVPLVVEVTHPGADTSDWINYLLGIRRIQGDTGKIQAALSGAVGIKRPGDPLQPANLPSSPSSYRYLQALATLRCMLDNVPTVVGAWEEQGAKIGQVALRYGANDFGSARWISDGTRGAWELDPEEIERLIRTAGFMPAPVGGVSGDGDAEGRRSLPLIQGSPAPPQP